MSAISVLPPAVRTYVHDFDARARRLALLRGIGIAVAALLAWVLACVLVDRVAQLSPVARLCLLGVAVVGTVGLVWWFIARALRRDVDWTGAAERIESRTPVFGQRLVTVVSRVLGPAEHRGSDEMLRALLRDVDGQAERRDPSSLLPLRQVAWPWVVIAVLGGTFAILARVPTIQLTDLGRRFFLPLADLPPVTTTRLGVPTGSRDVVQSASLRVDANVARMRPGAQVLLFISGEGEGEWSRNTMEPLPAAQRADGGQFAFTISSVDRDFRYYITADDARSRTFAVRVKRPPAVARFSIRYDYPAYSGRSALTVGNSDGLIEAPIGTRATVTITATEPLERATLAIGADRISMDRVDAGSASGDDAARMRRAAITVSKDSRYALELVSERQVPGVGPAGTMQIRAIPDGKPLVRLSRAGESLRLHPREILPLSYQALDDYGIQSLKLVAQVNSATPVEVPLELRGDVRRQERGYEFDLATLPLTVGDVLTVSLAVTDSAGQRAATDAVQVLVSPRSVDVATYQRIAELERSADAAATLNEQLAAAAAALAEADREAASRSLAFLAAVNRSNRQLSGAAETATLMTKSMYRAVVNGRSAELNNALAGWIDEARVQAWLAEDLFRRADQPAGMNNESRSLLARSLESTRVLREEIRTVATGERAAALLADRENLTASRKRAEAAQQPADKQRLEQSLARAGEDVAAGVREMGLDSAADLDGQLKAHVDAAQALLKAKPVLDFAAAAKDWSLALQRDRTQPLALDERLAAGAEAEALRYDADLIRARDLNLASRAASRVEALAQADPSGRTISAAMFDEFAGAIAGTQREQELNRIERTGQKPGQAERDAVHTVAENGRRLLQRWAGEASGEEETAAGPLYGMPGHQSQLESIALRASAETASRNYVAASALDNRLAGGIGGPQTTPPGPAGATQPSVASSQPTSQPVSQPGTFHHDVQQAVKRAQKLDTLGADQEKLAAATSMPATQQAPTLAGRQREVAEAIAEVVKRPSGRDTESPPSADPVASDPSWRGRATAAVLAAQEALAAMPQQLAAAQDALPTWRDALARAEQARREASAMPDSARQPAAQRAAVQAESDAADAAQRFQERRKPVSPTAAQRLATNLEPFAPETDEAADILAHSLLPALQRIEDAAVGGNIAGVARAADEARQAIEGAQRELAHAQEQLTARDPLVAAKWFARAAAGSLAQSPPDMRAAQSRQRDVTDALALAWDRTVHEAAALRMSALPSMQSIYGNPFPATTGPASDNPVSTAAPIASGTPAGTSAPSNAGETTPVPDWVRLRPRELPSVSAGISNESDPQGFEEPLRLYFQALAKLQSQGSPATTQASTQPASPTTTTAPAK